MTAMGCTNQNVPLATRNVLNNLSKFAQHIIDEGHAFGPVNDNENNSRCKKKVECFTHWKNFTCTGRQNSEINLTTSLLYNPTRSLRLQFNTPPIGDHNSIRSEHTIMSTVVLCMMICEYYSELLERRTEDIDSPQQNGQTTLE